MPEPMDELDAKLRDRIGAAESRVRVSSTPPADPTEAPRPARWLRPALTLATAGAAVVLAALVIGGLPDRLIGDATPSPSADPAVSASAEASVSPSTAPTETSRMSLAPSAEPTSEWRTFDISEVVGRTNINYGNTQFSGISEARDILFVTGRAAPQQPGIWWSADGMTWHRGDVPRAPDPYGFTVRDVVDAGPRFVAVADGGLAEGSGIFATAIYVSEDGRTWRNAESIPAVESGGHSSLVRSGDRLFAIGTSVWASGDGGLTWAEHVSADDWAGRAFDGDARGDVILAAGQAGIGDTVEGPGYAWVSTDSGQTWRRALVDDGSVLSSAAVTPDGKLVVARTSSVRTSIDNGVTWPISEVPLPCCGSELVTTASGLLAVMHAEAEPSRMAISEDGITWEPAGAAPVPVRDAAWGPRFGLVVVGQTTVGIGPDRYR